MTYYELLEGYKVKKIILIIILSLILIPIVIYFIFPEILYIFSISSIRKASGLSEKVINVDDYSIHYLEGGKGETILLIHGFDANKDNWSRFAKFLTKKYHVVAIDLPGFGESSKIETDSYNIASQTKRLNTIVKALGLKKFHIAGNSMGGAIVGKYSVNYPDKVLSLALVNTAGIYSAETSEVMKLVEKGENPLLSKTPEDFKELIKFVFVKPPLIPGRILDYLTKEAIINRDFNEKIFAQLSDEKYSLENDLSKIKANTITIWGDKDRVLHVSCTDVIRRELPDSTIVILENCGHAPMLEKPKETAEHYLKFLNSIKK